MRVRRWARIAVALAGAFVLNGVAAKTYHCTGPDGKPLISDRPCPVIREPEPPPLPPLPCSLKAEQKAHAVRVEEQFLRLFPTAASHHDAEWAKLRVVAGNVQSSMVRLNELLLKRKKLELEREFYPVPPPWLKAALDESDARFAALAEVLRNLEQEVTDIATRSRCERDTFGKRWLGAPPGSSACGRPACAGP